MIHVFIGTGVGALIGGGTVAITSLFQGKAIDWKSVGAGFLGGAAFGAIASSTFGTGLLAGTTVARTAGMVGAGAASGFTEQTTDNVFHGREWSEGVTESTALGSAVGLGAGTLRIAALPAAAALKSGAVQKVVSGGAGFAKQMPKKILDGSIYGITNAVLAVLVYNKITAGTFNIISTVNEVLGQDNDDVGNSTVLALNARDANVRFARDEIDRRISRIDWVVSVVNSLKTRQEMLRTRAMLLEGKPEAEAERAEVEATAAVIDTQINTILNHLAWFYHQYDELEGVMKRRLVGYGFEIDELPEGAGFRMTLGEHSGSYKKGQTYPDDPTGIGITESIATSSGASPSKPN